MTGNPTLGTISGANQLDKESIGKVLGRIPSGVYIITIQDGQHREGLLATWVAQAGFEPPQITVAVNKQRPITPMLKVGAKFTVNVLSKANMDIFKAFAAPAKEGLDRFDGLSLKDAANGPVFASAIAHLDCFVSHIVELNDHVVIVGEVIGGAPLEFDAEPMVHLRKNGFQY